LREVKKILGMKITQDRGENYVLKVLERFNIAEAKPAITPLAGHFKLSSRQCPQLPEEEKMSRVPYASAVRSLMYIMVCTRPDLGYTVSTISRFMSNLEK